MFKPASKRQLPETPPALGAVWFGHFGNDGLADEVVLAVKQLQPRPWLEIHSHGGQPVIAWLLELLRQQEIESRSWPQFLAEIEPPWRVAAQQLLASAPTARTAAILLDQFDGAFQRELHGIRDEARTGDNFAALSRIDSILRYASIGLHLVDPWRIVVAAAPNAGKSSLVNALAGFQRSVVAAVPGTTRDVVATRLAIDGWPVELLDTAGIRADADGLEQAGIDIARDVIDSADLCLWIVDAENPVWPEPLATPMLVVLNKCDLLETGLDDDHIEVRVSAKTGAGIHSLLGGISRKIVADPPPSGVAVPIESRQIRNLVVLRAGLAANDKAVVQRTFIELGI